MGRKSTYTATVAALICERLAQGEPLSRICEDEDMPPAPTVRGWIADDIQGFAALSARAYRLGYDATAEDCLEIADNAKNDWMERNGQDDSGWVANGENIQRSRLRIDTRLRLLGKWDKKRYGDHQQVEHTVSDSLAQTILAARKRSGKES